MADSLPQDALSFPKDAVVFRQGDPGREMFLIATGRIRLTIGGQGHERELAVLNAGEFFGELALLSDEIRTATATAVEDTRLLAISRDVFTMMVQDDLEIVAHMLSIQGRRLSRANQPIQELSRRVDHIRVTAHCLNRVAGPHAQLPATIDVESLATELGLDAQAVHTIIGELAGAGIGTYHQHQWTIQDRGHVAALVQAVCRYADGGTQ